MLQGRAPAPPARGCWNGHLAAEKVWKGHSWKCRACDRTRKQADRGGLKGHTRSEIENAVDPRAVVGDLPERLGWWTEALCAGMDSDIFFPDQGGDTRTGTAICAVCPVRLWCLAEGINEKHGTWGGLTAFERVAVRREVRRGNDVSGLVSIQRMLAV